MSRILSSEPNKGETKADWLISTLFSAARGKGEEKGLAELALRFNILCELDNNEGGVEFDENGSRQIVAAYSLPESVEKDLKLTDYGQGQFVSHYFPVMNSFAVTGNLNGSTAGFVLDFFSRNIKPTTTMGFAQQRFSQKNIAKAAEKIFSLGRPASRLEYQQKATRKGIIHLRQYGGGRNIIASICDGELAATGKPVYHNNMVKAMMRNVLEHTGFTPEKYVMNHYDVLTHFGKGDSEATHRRKFEDLQRRVNRVIADKAASVS